MLRPAKQIHRPCFFGLISVLCKHSQISGQCIRTAGDVYHPFRLHQGYRKKLIGDYEAIESLVRTAGAAFCISGAGPTLLCITMDPKLEEKLGKKLETVTKANWQMIPLHIDFKGAHVVE